MAPPACRRAQLIVPHPHYGDSIQCSAIGESMRRWASTRLFAIDFVRVLAVRYLLSVCTHSMSCLVARDALVLRPICTRDGAGRVHRPSEFVCLFVCLLVARHRHRHRRRVASRRVALQECVNPSAAKSHFFEELGCKCKHPLQRWCSVAHSSTGLHDSKRRAQLAANASDMRHTTAYNAQRYNAQRARCMTARNPTGSNRLVVLNRMAASNPSRWRFAAFQSKLKPLVQPCSRQAAGKCNLDSRSESTACVRAGCAAVAAQVRTRQPSIVLLGCIASVLCS